MSNKEYRKFKMKNPGRNAMGGPFRVDGLGAAMGGMDAVRAEGLAFVRSVSETQMAAFNSITTSSFYLLAQFTPDETTEEQVYRAPLLQGIYVKSFYNKAYSAYEKRNKSLQTLCEGGGILLSDDPEVQAQIASAETKILIAQGVLDESYTQVNFLTTFNDTPSSVPGGIQYFSPRDKIEVGKIVARMGTSKPE